MSTALVVLYLQTQDSLNIEWPSGSEAQAQRERRVRWDDALILWHSELITQLFHTLQSPGNWQSCLIIHHNAAAVPPGQDKKGWVKREKSQIIHCGIFYHWSSFLLRKFFMVFFFQIHFWICKLSNSYPCSLNYCGICWYLCSKILSKCKCLLSNSNSGRTPQHESSMTTSSGLSLIWQIKPSFICPTFVGYDQSVNSL